MNYGYFDQTKKEYVITRPYTPEPWVNYLGSPLYGAIISNNAGGYSFVKSGAKGRILRYRFNSDDKPGRYIYIRDDISKDYWSTSWQPVGKSKGYINYCRHGLGYTTIETEFDDIKSEVSYFVPLNKTYEIWKTKIKNISNRDRKLSVFGYAEFTNDSDYEQDSVNLQYSQFITRTYFKSNRIFQTINKHTEEKKENSRFFGLVGSPIISYDGDKKSFIGNYHTYGNPKAVIHGRCGNMLNYNSNSCGALHTQFSLKPGQEKEILFILGEHAEDRAEEIIAKYEHSDDKANRDLKELKRHWHSKLEAFKVYTPDENFNNMVNIWNAYQCLITSTWSRAASLTYCGQRNGFGYRDTVQDIQGIIHLTPRIAKKQLVFMLSAQVDNGAGLPLVKYSHTPGSEDTPEDFSYRKETGHTAYRADDALWLFPSLKKYLSETGELAYLDEFVPYANKGEDTIYNHLKKAIEFSMNRLGANGLPAGLHADWNDCLRLGKNGESTFVAMQLYLALSIMEEFSTMKKDVDYLKYLTQEKQQLYQRINRLCFEGDRYIRGITEDGQLIGSKDNKEASMWLNPQSWAVISGVADYEQREIILENVYQQLNTDYGARIMIPSFKKHAFSGALAAVYNGSTKENGSVFLQPQGWLILAEALAGHGNRAYEYYKESSPAHQNNIAEIRGVEPYVYSQFTESIESPFEGRSHVHWLTGTASTVMIGCIEGILGIQPDLNGIKISPTIPSEWNTVKIEKTFRGRKLSIYIDNKNGNENGYKEIYLNNVKLDSNYILESQLQEVNEILFLM